MKVAVTEQPEVAWWMLDFSAPGLQKRMNKTRGLMASAPFKFAPDTGLAYFEDLGWTTVEVESVFSAANRFHRLPWWLQVFTPLPQPDPRKPGNETWSAVARLTH